MPKIVDHDKRKELIADAMMTIIRRVGLEKTTVRRIAEEAGLSMGSVQYYFPAQHDLYIFAMELLIKRLEDRVKNAMKEDTPVIEAVSAVLMQLIPYYDEDHQIECEAWLVFSLMALRDPTLEALSRSMYKSVRELISQLLTLLHEEGMLEESFDLNIGVIGLHALIDGMTTQSILYQKLFNEEKIDLQIKGYIQSICRK
ncbi:AcrR family transcriptional regulator [Cytobacillus eiseniae]|uniref:AcrR family transcriptional regulator n=1 Tax=Cytobacillus eiseniae TaxID=762947 RepID=A0ABS4RKB3_9BACI|nr:TetR family transcriptional regulator C-terminal domain-containing protein [Cytobacillus eiseniae]MBP2243333.1 AcrR family transcriptional regulator [Cytobacillus eiseniae]